MFPGLDLLLSSFVFCNVKCYYFNRPSSRKVLPVYCSNITFLVWLYTCNARKIKHDMSCEWRDIFLLPTNPSLWNIVGGYLFSFTSLGHTGNHQLQTQFTHLENMNGVQLRQEFITFVLLSILFYASNIATCGTGNAQCPTEGFAFRLYRFLQMSRTTQSLGCSSCQNNSASLTSVYFKVM